MSIQLNPLSNVPIKYKRKANKQKQNKWVLDCVNEQKSKLKPYSSLKDRYLKYFVIGVPKKRKFMNKSRSKKPRQPFLESQNFQSFLSMQKQKILQNRTKTAESHPRNISKKYQDSIRPKDKQDQNKQQLNRRESANYTDETKEKKHQDPKILQKTSQEDKSEHQNETRPQKIKKKLSQKSEKQIQQFHKEE